MQWSIIQQKNEQNANSCHIKDEFLMYSTRWNMPVTKAHILYDFTYMKYLKYANS